MLTPIGNNHHVTLKPCIKEMGRYPFFVNITNRNINNRGYINSEGSILLCLLVPKYLHHKNKSKIAKKLCAKKRLHFNIISTELENNRGRVWLDYFGETKFT